MLMVTKTKTQLPNFLRTEPATHRSFSASSAQYLSSENEQRLFGKWLLEGVEAGDAAWMKTGAWIQYRFSSGAETVL